VRTDIALCARAPKSIMRRTFVVRRTSQQADENASD